MEQPPANTKAGPPCHFINRYNKNICSETNDTQSCRMGWERPGNCNDAGYTVCCQLNNDKYYFKAGLKCSDGIVAPGSQPFKPCDTTANIPVEIGTAPTMSIVETAVPTLALSTVKVGPPCHFINRYNKYICSETNDTQSCRMGWERPGNCNDAGYTVCCQLNNDKYYFKAGLKCSDGIVAPGSQPFKPCDTTANIPDQSRQ